MAKSSFFIAFFGILYVWACSKPQVQPESPPPTELSFPANYRSWKRLNPSPIIRETEKIARDLYANEIALHRDQSGRFPVGSILVKEERELSEDVGGRLQPKDVIRVSVMFKVGRGPTEGWAFKAFDPETRQEFPKDKVDPEGCYFCHTDARDNDYVFSEVK